MRNKKEIARMIQFYIKNRDNYVKKKDYLMAAVLDTRIYYLSNLANSSEMILKAIKEDIKTEIKKYEKLGMYWSLVNLQLELEEINFLLKEK